MDNTSPAVSAAAPRRPSLPPDDRKDDKPSAHPRMLRVHSSLRNDTLEAQNRRFLDFCRDSEPGDIRAKPKREEDVQQASRLRQLYKLTVHALLEHGRWC